MNGSATAADAITLSPGFKPDGENYTARVANSVTAVEVVATAADGGARPVVTAESGRTVADDTNTNDNNVAVGVSGLKEGANVITIKVTAADLEATKTYTVTVTQAAANASDDAGLSALMVGSESVSNASRKGTLSADTAPTTPDHSTGVANGVNSIAISATPNHSGAVVSIFSVAGNTNDQPIAHAAGTPVGADGMVSLSIGRNLARIQVTAENGSTVRNYFVEITRASAGASGDAKLAATTGLSLSSVTLSPVFSPNTMMYSAEVPVNITSTTVRAEADSTATSVVIKSDTDDTLGPDLDAQDMAYITSHSIDLSAGANVITIVVTAEDYETMETYTVRVSRGVSNDASLSSLSLMDSDGMAIDLKDMDGMAAEFMADTMMYYADVDNDVEMINVMATAMDSDATVSGDGAVSLDVGENTITVTVTAEDGTTMMTYTVMVTRAPPVEGTLLDRYDADDSGDIDLTEVSAAIDDYFNGDLTLAQVSDVIDLYFQ